MKFAVSKIAITPEFQVFMAGFGNRSRKSEGVLDDLYANAVLLQDNRTLLMLALDLLGGDRSFVDGILAALNERFGLQKEEIVINFSHTHSAVYATGVDPGSRRGNYSMGQTAWQDRYDEADFDADIGYFHFVRRKIIEMVQRCYEELQSGTMEAGIGTTEIGIHRRRMTAQGIRFMPNPDGEIDRDLTVFRLTTADNRVAAILFSCACHPTCLNEYVLSAEFPGRARRILEARYPGATAVFLQGCTAEVHPLACADGDRFKACSEAEMHEVGAQLAGEVDDCLKRHAFTLVQGPLRASRAEYRLFLEPWGIPDIERAFVANPDKGAFQKRGAAISIDLIRRGLVKTDLHTCMSVWQLGKWILVAMEGEAPSEYALKIKRLLAGRHVVTLGYSNGVSSYIPTRLMLREGGYEAEAYILHGYRGPLVPESEDITIGTAVRLTLLNADGEHHK